MRSSASAVRLPSWRRQVAKLDKPTWNPFVNVAIPYRAAQAQVGEQGKTRANLRWFLVAFQPLNRGHIFQAHPRKERRRGHDERTGDKTD